MNGSQLQIHYTHSDTDPLLSMSNMKNCLSFQVEKKKDEEEKQ